MAAGPYPTKQMHEALKTRVSTLEQAPQSGGGGAAGVLGHGARAGVAYSEYDMMIGALAATQDIRVEVSWAGVAQLVGGFRVAGATLALADLAFFAVITGGEVETVYGDANSMTVQPYTIRNPYGETVESGTEFLVSQEHQATCEYGKMVVAFKPSAAAKLPALAYEVGTEPPLLLPGTTYALMVQETGTPINTLIPIKTAACGPVSVGVLSPFNLPMVASPTPVYDSQYEDKDRQGGMEVVWPLGGTPYLHVFRPDHRNRPGERFHLPLTPGLPQ